jgi:hypothetical protein
MVSWVVTELYSKTVSSDQPLLSFGPSFFCLVHVIVTGNHIFSFLYIMFMTKSSSYACDTVS